MCFNVEELDHQLSIAHQILVDNLWRVHGHNRMCVEEAIESLEHVQIDEEYGE